MNNQTNKKMKKSVATVIVLTVCLCITTFALIREIVKVEDNLFQTGTIKINLNDGKPIIDDQEFLFEPGMRVEKTFFLENKGSWDVYYKLYLDEIDGDLANVLDVEIRCDEKVLYRGKAAELTKENVESADDILKAQEHQEFTIQFHYPENAGNETQNQFLTFTLGAQAVQTKNNPNQTFE